MIFTYENINEALFFVDISHHFFHFMLYLFFIECGIKLNLDMKRPRNTHILFGNQNFWSCYLLLSVSLAKVNKPNKYILISTSIKLFHSWHTIIRNKLMLISWFFRNVCQLRNKFMLMWNKNIFIPNVRICQTTWQQQLSKRNKKYFGESSYKKGYIKFVLLLKIFKD